MSNVQTEKVYLQFGQTADVNCMYKKFFYGQMVAL